MKITEIFIDGFRNVRSTRLDFSKESIIVLLAPNNYGKTNLLHGIQEGFNLISRQATEVVDYIRIGSYVDKYAENPKEPQLFKFGVRFFKRDNKSLYHYEFCIDGRTIERKKKDGVLEKGVKGIIFEKLSIEDENGNIVTPLFIRGNNEYKTDSKEEVLRQIDLDLSSASFYYDGRYHLADIKHSTFATDDDDPDPDDDKLYPPEYYLFLHSFGNTPLFGLPKEHNPKIVEVLKEISGVLTSLTRDNIGKIIADEDSDYQNPVSLANAARRLYNDCDLFPEYEYFKETFVKLFPTYTQIESIPIGDSKQHQFLFKKQLQNERMVDETTATLSYGTRRIFKLLSLLCINKTPLVCLEELEIGLHPVLYGKVMTAFQDCLDRVEYERRNEGKIPPAKQRKNEPRLIISSHAPGIVNALKDHMNSIYIAVPGSEKSGFAQFKKLGEKGLKIVSTAVTERRSRVGDYIFQRFSEECLLDENLEFFE